ncbi:MAG: putative iron-regulated protein [Candidatus Binatia bacterium]|jgi:uncharacterized iron-regulated protein
MEHLAKILLLATLSLATVSLAVGCAPGPLGLWQSSHLRAHPLVGQVYDVTGDSVTRPQALFDAACHARFVLLGEQHDNADHHRIQAWVLRELGGCVGDASVVLEQVDRGRSLELAAAVSTARRDPDVIADAVDWKQSGWPPFREYRSVVEEALRHGFPLVAGNLSRADIRALTDMSRNAENDAEPDGKARVDALRAELAWMPPLTEQGREALAEDIRASHCGMASAGMIDAMVAGQRARDAVLARSLTDAAQGRDAAILIAGFGHTRRDFGVPHYLSELEPDGAVVSVGILEVRDSATTFDAYREAFGGSFPFDFVWFTPRASNEDPCEKFREALERMKAAHQAVAE